MYELIRAGEKTYYMDCPSKVGIYNYSGNDVCLIDSGNDKDAAKKVLKHIENNGWSLKFIVNTHSHADHIGGNAFLQEKTGCKIYASGIDVCFCVQPVLEPSLIYGANPLPALRNKFLLAKESKVEDISELSYEGIFEIVKLPGHSFDMIALKTSDNIWFVADAVASEATLEKYHISFMYDVASYLESLKVLCTLEGDMLIPSHAAPTDNIKKLAELNEKKVNSIAGLIVNICKNATDFDGILKEAFDSFGLTLDVSQYALSGSTIRSYLTYLEESGKLCHTVSDNRLLWKSL